MNALPPAGHPAPSLLGLTYLTVQDAFVDLGGFITLAALVIASGKAVLVVLYFMHVHALTY